MECLLPYLCMVTVPHIMVGLERMLDYRGVGLARFHCIEMYIQMYSSLCAIWTPERSFISNKTYLFCYQKDRISSRSVSLHSY